MALLWASRSETNPKLPAFLCRGRRGLLVMRWKNRIFLATVRLSASGGLRGLCKCLAAANVGSRRLQIYRDRWRLLHQGVFPIAICGWNIQNLP